MNVSLMLLPRSVEKRRDPDGHCVCFRRAQFPRFAASPQLSVVSVNNATGKVDGVMINEGMYGHALRTLQHAL